VTNTNHAGLLDQMPTVPGVRKPPKRSDGPEEYASLFDQRSQMTVRAATTNDPANKLVFVPGEYHEVEGAALPMLGVDDDRRAPASCSRAKAAVVPLVAHAQERRRARRRL
jgi:hypothetical protein